MISFKKALFTGMTILAAFNGFAQNSTEYKLDTTLVGYNDTIQERGVVVNRLRDNWFVTASGGIHWFKGDFNDYGKRKDRLSPDWYVGFGKWFVPAFALKMEFGMSNSKGFTNENNPTVFTITDELYHTEDGIGYYKQRMNWWDLNLQIMLNMTRLITGYEGPDSPKNMNQIILTGGVGAVHEFKKDAVIGSNLCSVHSELIYNRFIDKGKHFSIDAKARLIAYQDNFDGNTSIDGKKKWDCNLGFALGLTYNFKENTWQKPNRVSSEVSYMTREQYERIEIESKTADVKELSFYIHYPDSSALGVLANNEQNSHEALKSLKSNGYKSKKSELLYSFADFCAATNKLSGDTTTVKGADKNAATELSKILIKYPLSKISIVSMGKKMDYYTNNIATQAQNSQNLATVNQRNAELISALKQVDLLSKVEPTITITNQLDVDNENCTKVTIQYLTEGK